MDEFMHACASRKTVEEFVACWPHEKEEERVEKRYHTTRKGGTKDYRSRITLKDIDSTRLDSTQSMTSSIILNHEYNGSERENMHWRGREGNTIENERSRNRSPSTSKLKLILLNIK